MSGTYAKSTDVSSSKSRQEIELTLERYGATQFAYATSESDAMVAFVAHEKQIRFILPLPSRNEREFTHHSRGVRTPSAAQDQYEQAVRQKWRALALVVKAKLEAVESGITTFEQEFFGNIVLPGGQTVYQTTGEQVARALATGTVPRLFQLEG